MRSFIHSVKNLIKWFPIIWKDHNYDYGYLLTIMEFKLKNMEEFFNSNQTSVSNAKRSAHEIMIVKNLIKRIKNDNYYELNDYDFEKAQYMIKQDFDYLGLMLKKHLRGWWD